MVDLWPFALIGFSVVIGPVLVLAYLRSDLFPKSLYSVTSVILLTLCLLLLQFHHTAFFAGVSTPTAEWSYIYALMLAPALFFFFGRFVIAPDSTFSPYLLVCLIPCVLPSLVSAKTATNVVLFIGSGYALWFAWIVLSIRALRKQHAFEMGFAVVITLMAAGIFILSAFLQSDALFYLFYSQSIGIAYILVTFALLAIPDFVNDLFELARSKYLHSTLGTIDEMQKLAELDQFMQGREPWREENLTLAGLAQEVELSSHQLSELLNHHKGVSFSNYIRGYRIEAAKTQLVADPDTSVLAISLDVGFRSQSTFYTAFKAATGQSPGDYRKQHSI
ncbi:MAG: helix-turn-helix domain-containing protein [Pseudomonadota bacterium]